MSLLPIQLPEFNRPVRAIVKCTSFRDKSEWWVQEDNLVAVDDSDCNWRFADDSNAELAYFADVVYWEYIEES